jgi:hypothetical protein
MKLVAVAVTVVIFCGFGRWFLSWTQTPNSDTKITTAMNKNTITPMKYDRLGSGLGLKKPMLNSVGTCGSFPAGCGFVSGFGRSSSSM